MYVTVKMPREKMKELREIKARLMLGGNIHATDSDALGSALDLAKKHEGELPLFDNSQQMQELSKFFGAWSYLSDAEVNKRKGEIVKWRKNLVRSFV